MKEPYTPSLIKFLELNCSHVSPNAFTSFLVGAFDLTRSADKLELIILRSLYTSPTERN